MGRLQIWLATFCCVFVTVIAPFVVTGQEFNAGIYAGLSACQLDGDTYDGYNKPAFNAGGYVNRIVTKKTAVQIGIGYAQKGSRRINSNADQYYKCDLHYVTMPITMRYYYYKKLDFEIGLSPGYLLKAREDIYANGWKEANPPFNKFELAALAGLNYHFSKKIAVSAQFNYSLLAVRPYSSGYSNYMDKGQYNNIISFGAHYVFNHWR
jgi:hypothetical protein